jgi:hypothetical protein
MKSTSIKAGALSIMLAVTMFSTTAFAASINFNDVPTSHWAHASISKMADKGIVAGVGDGRYSPEGTVTNAAFITMISRQFYQTKDGGDVWYAPHLQAAQNAGILKGTMIGMDNGLANNTINRYDMAQIMYNVMGSPAATGDTSKISDWGSVPASYRNAVNYCYSMSLLTGVDTSGTFHGDGVMTRAQAAAVMDRLITAKGDNTTPTPPPEQQPPEGTEKLFVTPSMLVGGLAEGQSFNNGVFTMNYTDKGTINSAPMKLTLKNSGYSKITLTVKSNYDGELPLGVAGVDNPYKSDVRYTTYDKGNHMQLGETRTITVDISGTKSFVVSIGGVSVHAEISNIYFHN